MVEILAYADEQGRITPSTLRHAPLYAPRRTSMALGIALALADAAGRVYAVWDESKHPRDEEGKWATKSVPGADGNVPAEPGTTPIPEGHVRLYHQTDEQSLMAIAKSGLKLEYAKGFEGPKAIYAGEEPFYGSADSRPTLEFSVPRDKWSSPFVLQDVLPQNMIAAHLPWHRHARYLSAEGGLERTLKGEFDFLLKDIDNPNASDEARAVVYVKQNYGPKLFVTSYAISRPLYVSRSVENADEIIAWAKSQGIETTLPPEEMHVTVCYSRDAVDWQTFTHMNDTFELPASGVRELAWDESKHPRDPDGKWTDGAGSLSENSSGADLRDARAKFVSSGIVLEYAQDDAGYEGTWKTIRGSRVFIRAGETLTKAFQRRQKEHLRGVLIGRDQALSSYSEHTHIFINGRLRGKTERGYVQTDPLIRQLDDAFSTEGAHLIMKEGKILHRYAESESLYKLLSKTRVGSVIEDKAFLSTSRNQRLIERVGFNMVGKGAVLRIFAPKGTKYLVGRTDEQEWVLNRSTQLKLKSISGSGGVLYVDVDVVGEGSKKKYSKEEIIFVALSPPYDDEQDTGYAQTESDFLNRIVWQEGDLEVIKDYVEIKENVQDSEGKEGEWKTINGRHIFIREGESLDEAFGRGVTPVVSENSAYKDKTLAQMEQHFKDKYQGRVVIRNNLKDAKRAASLLGATAQNLDDLEHSGEVVRQALFGHQNYLTLELQPGATVFNESHNHKALAYYNKLDHKVTIADGLRLTNTSLKPSVGTGSHNVGTDFHAVLSHEFGHAVSARIAIAAGKSGLPVGLELYNSKPKEYWQKKVSTYAGTNVRELMAEAFSAYTHPGYKNSKGLPKELISVFEAAGIKSGTRKYEQEEEGYYADDGKWITVNGRHVLIKDGEEVGDAIKRSDDRKRLDAARDLKGVEASKALSETFKYPPPELTVEHRAALRTYIADGSFVNTRLRDAMLQADTFAPAIDRAVTGLDQVFEAMPPTTSEFTVIRGMSIGAVGKIGFEVGAVVKDAGYVSTTVSKEVASGFGNTYDMKAKKYIDPVLFEVKVPAGSKVLSIPSLHIAGTTYSDREAEVLLPRGSKFRITAVKGNTVQAELLLQGQYAEFVQGDYADTTLTRLGDKGAVVLKFESPQLSERHNYFRELGASWDYEEYTPHITLSYTVPDGFDLDAVQPYTGRIVLGPEEFEELDTDRGGKVKEHADDGKWITVKGRHVFIKEGESLEQALGKGSKVAVSEDWQQQKFLSAENQKTLKVESDKILSSFGFDKDRVPFGQCAVTCIKMWDVLGQPKDVVPTSVMIGEDEHVILVNQKKGWALDPTGRQYDEPFYHPFVKDRTKTPYRSFKRLSKQELEDMRTEANSILEKGKKKYSQQDPITIDYAQIKNDLDAMEGKFRDELRELLTQSRNALMATVRRRGAQLEDVGRTLELPYAKDIENAIAEALQRAMDRGGADARKEILPLVKEHAEDGKWITVKGRHVFIKEGETLDQSLERSNKSFDPEVMTRWRDKVIKAGGSKELLDSMSEDELKALQKYTSQSTDHEDLNRALRVGTLTVDQEKFRDDLTSAIKKLPESQGQAVRGMPRWPGGSPKSGQVVEDSAFTSTSSHGGITDRFGKVKIFYPYGVGKGHQLGAFSNYPDENEVIRLPGQRYIIDRVTKTKDGRMTVYLATTPKQMSVEEVIKLPYLDYSTYAISFTPKAAIKWLKAKVFWVSDVLSTGLLNDIRLILINGLKTGKLNDEIVTDIANAYVPYLGDPKAVKTSGAALPTAARLETVVRTNLTEAYSKGRLSEYIKPKILPFLDGIKYSAILDSRTCFVSGTLVNLARGGYKAIDKLVLGDQVVSGAGIVRRVVGTKKKVAYNLVLIETDEGDSIVCTPTHPFWIRTEEGYQWQEAWSLRQGGECGTRDMRGLSSEVYSLGDTPRVFCSASLQNLLGEAPIQEAQGPVRFQSRTSGQAKFNLQGYMEEAFKESEKTNISCTESGCCELASCESGMEQETPFQGAVVEGFFRTDNAKRGGQEIRSHQARSVLVEKNVRSTQYRPERVLDEIPCFAPEFIHDQTIQTPETSWRFIKGTKNRVVYSGDCLCSRFSMAEETPSCGLRRTILARSYEDEGQESGQADRSFRLEDTSGSRDRAREESSLSKGHNQRKADCSVMPISTGFCKISSVRIFPACAWVYDIEVEADHSYLVGQQGLIAHNTQVCNFLHGKVFKPTDPVLDGLCPPNHFNCRSLLVPCVVGEKIPDTAWITKAEIEQARGLADVKFLEQEDLQEYDQDDEGHEGKWVTVRGRAVFIRKDEDMESALTRSLLKKGSERPKADEEDKTLAGLLAGNASRLKGGQKKKGLFGRLFTEDGKRKPRPRIMPRTVKK